MKAFEDLPVMEECMRWFGPNDSVTLQEIRQTGAAAVFTSLHEIPYGEEWPEGLIRSRKAGIEAAGLRWTAVESVPVHESIKTRTGCFQACIQNYKTTLRRLGAAGIRTVVYNFMPVLDWVRTDLHYELPTKATALYFNRLDYLVFDIYLLGRPDAAKDYTAAELEKAQAHFASMTEAKKKQLFSNMMLGLPGSDESFTPEQVLAELKKYEGITTAKLKEHLFAFLKEIVPAAEAAGVVLAIHPDDPPYPVLGLPRIVSTEQDAAELLAAVPSPANGLCFCTGSYGARKDNDIPKMLHRFGDRVHFLHLRNTKRDAEGNFFEADHLGGDTDMVAVIKEVLAIQKRRNISLPMRPDHGHQMLDDLKKKTYAGYSAIGRLKGLAELRGVEYALSKLEARS